MRRFLSALAAAALIGVVATGAVVAHDIIPGDTVAPEAESHDTIAGNPQCGGGWAYSQKIEAEDLGVGNYGAIDITYYDGKYVSWAINSAYLNTYDANTVIVKGGPNAVEYEYLDGDDDWDIRLTAPRNYNGAQPKYYGISHIQFCFDPKNG